MNVRFVTMPEACCRAMRAIEEREARRDCASMLTDVVKILNTESGLKGLCGSNDMREIVKRMKEGNKQAQLAFDVFCYSVRKYIGDYFFVLNCKVDAIIFTGGIGGNSPDVRSTILHGLTKIGVVLDEDMNNTKEKKEIWQISEENFEGRILVGRVFVIKTNEELEVAQQIFNSVQQTQAK